MPNSSQLIYSRDLVTFSASGTSDGYINDLCSDRSVLFAYGTWGGGTLTVEQSPNFFEAGSVWMPVLDLLRQPVSLTANGYFDIGFLGKNISLRCVLAGATSPSIVVRLFRSGLIGA